MVKCLTCSSGATCTNCDSTSSKYLNLAATNCVDVCYSDNS